MRCIKSQYRQQAISSPRGFLHPLHHRRRKDVPANREGHMEIRKCFFLNQSLHPFHTQTNEARNQAQAGLTPKAKSFHESMSFHYRHAIQVGTHNLGFRQFWTQVFDDIGVPYSQSFVDHLDRVVNRRKR